MESHITRTDVLHKIGLLLDRTVQPQDVYEWALRIAVSDGYRAFADQDAIAAEAIHEMMNMSEDHVISADELKVLEYYRQCLSGDRKDVSLDRDAALRCDLPAALFARWADCLTSQPKTPKEMALKAMRIYISIFAAFVLAHNFWLLFQLGGPWSHQRTSAVMTFPFLIYGFLLLLPMPAIATSKAFLVSLVLLVMAIGYFWFSFFQMIFFSRFHFLGFFSGLFLGAIPATMALWLLIDEKYLKNISVVQSSEG